MAQITADEVDVPMAGSRVQISSNAWAVLSITFTAPALNKGRVYIGDSTVSATVGKPLEPGESFSDPPFEAHQDSGLPQTVPLSDYYIDAANNGDDVAYFARVHKL